MNAIENKYIHYDKLFNPDIKKEFLDIHADEKYKTSMYYSFKLYSNSEREFNKDIYEMNFNEIETLLHSLGASTLPSAENHILLINRYLSWAVEKGLTDTNILILENIDMKSYAKQFISAYKNPIFKEEEIHQMLELLPNDVDKALLLCIYEGIEGEGYSEILNLKIGDIQPTDSTEVYVANLRDKDGAERKLFISRKLYKLLDLADKQDSYYNEGAKLSHLAFTPFVESPYIFKKSKRGTGAGNITLDYFYVLRKFAHFKKTFDMPFLSGKDIKKSGIAACAFELFKNTGELTTIEYKFIGDKYDTTKTVTKGVSYRNTTVIKKILQHPSVISAYGVDMTL